MKHGILPTRAERREHGQPDNENRWELPAAKIAQVVHNFIYDDASELQIGHRIFTRTYDPGKSPAYRAMLERLREFNPVTLHSSKKR